MSEHSTTYVALAPCGCIRAAVVDGEHKREVARHVARWIREGYRIEHWPTEEVRSCTLWGCAQCDPMGFP